jgi:hypothetical protein
MQLVEHARLGPLGQATPAGRRRAAAEFAGREQPPGRGGAGHEHDRSEAGPVGNGTVSAAVRGTGRGRQQGLDQRPQLVGHKVISKGRHAAGACQRSLIGAKRPGSYDDEVSGSVSVSVRNDSASGRARSLRVKVSR